ncbi:hypothetical protein [Rhodococcus rhodochrous]|uniref:Uncharacterized protein n=1 Tax=Rhodococcus rhodochrous KG-21 TaxID=1441923 RepID=A0A0M8PMX2_RHORH|nr:hypothetical protein [Rhodococcus rhodochrous]KOS58205.1 hypothetical protein Z051_01200 [Rhodococcus rhodochrous KG-21]
MIEPDDDAVLASVITAIEDEITPACDEYAASVCRTAAQMLRHVRARLRYEAPALLAGNAELRGYLSEVDKDTLPGGVRERVESAVAAQPVPVHPDVVALRRDARVLREALVAVIDSVPEQHPARVAGRRHLSAQLQREMSWQQDAYTGPRR